MTTKPMRTALVLLMLLMAGVFTAGCANHEADIKAAHANEDAAAKQARIDKQSK